MKIENNMSSLFAQNAQRPTIRQADFSRDLGQLTEQTALTMKVAATQDNTSAVMGGGKSQANYIHGGSGYGGSSELAKLATSKLGRQIYILADAIKGGNPHIYSPQEFFVTGNNGLIVDGYM